MSEGTSYFQEPPTTGKVLLQTTVGDIDCELWCKEAPKACRNFIQLCMEGYYDNCIFHRVIKDFMAQTGDPTGTGHGGESIYGEPFKDEFHARLRFNRRGIIAMANNGDKNSNGSQFFFSLNECSWLQKKHTIFGKVTGKTIFNLVSFNDIETDSEDRPMYGAPKILRAEILNNPFDDIIPRVMKQSEEKKKKKKSKKDKKNLSLLSFGEEQNEEDTETVEITKQEKKEGKGTSKSSHDLLQDEKLSKEAVSVPDTVDEGSESGGDAEEEEEGDDAGDDTLAGSIRKKLTKKGGGKMQDKNQREKTEDKEEDEVANIVSERE